MLGGALSNTIWLAASHSPSPRVRWPVITNPLIETEILGEIRASEHHKAPDSDGLSPALSKDGAV